MTQNEQLQAVLDRKDALLQGDAEKTKTQHTRGSKTARERVSELVDAGSFVETEALKRDTGVVTGYGLVDERPVYIIAQDITLKGAAMNAAQADKMLNLLSRAKKTGAPVVIFADAEGFSVQEDARTLTAYAAVFSCMSRLSGVTPLITVTAGPCFGVAANFALLSDVAIAVEKTTLLMPVSPLVMNATAGTTLQPEELGGAGVLAHQGAVALVAKDDAQSTRLVKSVLAYLPSSNRESAPMHNGDDLNRLVAPDAGDGLALAQDVADQNATLELYTDFGMGLRTFLSRVGGQPCGIIAGEPNRDAGRLDAPSCQKAARLVRLCDCYGLPVVSLVNSAGLTVPQFSDQAALMRSAAQLNYAYAEATTAKITVFVGNAIGAAYVAMGGRGAADIAFAWPSAMIAPLTREAAVQTFAADRLKDEDRASLEEKYALSADGLAIASLGLADDVIDPIETRKHIIAAMELLYSKQDETPAREHGNMPL